MPLRLSATYYNTSLSGKGNQYADSKSRFLRGADSYILQTLTTNPGRMVVEIKGLDGTVPDRQDFSGKQRTKTAN